ncbi:MAG: GGDEF domain-containing protein [Candidatus Fermentibacteraceae bacterium]|nr:GGDEF domain-containing protein [Candidatus Fermentibacteraceae bacterium]
MAEIAAKKSQLKYPWTGELDSVTGIPPRKALDQNLPLLLRIMGKESMPLSVIMIDIDHFKKFNDRWGHDTGDQVLRHVCGILRRTVKYRGEAYRYGGEEITILLPNTSSAEAMATAEHIRELIYRSPLEPIDGTSSESSEIPLAVTVSLGVSTFPDVAGSELLVAADQALYIAKREGRNRAAFYDSTVKDDSSQVTLNVRFPAASSISEGSFIILTRWFRHRGELTEIEAREISDPGRGLREFAEGPVPPGGPVTAEIRGRVAAVERRGNSTFFSFEVEAEVLDLMFHHLKDREL